MERDTRVKICLFFRCAFSSSISLALLWRHIFECFDRHYFRCRSSSSLDVEKGQLCGEEQKKMLRFQPSKDDVQRCQGGVCVVGLDCKANEQRRSKNDCQNDLGGKKRCFDLVFFFFFLLWLVTIFARNVTISLSPLNIQLTECPCNPSSSISSRMLWLLFSAGESKPFHRRGKHPSCVRPIHERTSRRGWPFLSPVHMSIRGPVYSSWE